MMDESVVFLTICAFLLVVFLASLMMAMRGNAPAKYFLWTWAAMLVITLPFTTRANIISSLPAGLMLVFFLYVLIVGKMHSNVQLEVSHEETRRVLAESNRRIDEERRTISRRLHDEVNPNLVLCKNELKRLETFVKDDLKASKILASVQELLADAYSHTRDIIKNTRICCRRRKSVEIWRHKTAAEFGVDRLTHKGPGGPLVIYGRWGQKGGSFSGGSLRVMRSSRYRSSKAIS